MPPPKKKKPVKFTWNGLFNLGLQFSTNPGLSPLRQKRLQELREGNKANEKIKVTKMFHLLKLQ